MQKLIDKNARDVAVAYYSVSIEKFIIYSIISFGIFNLYWIYKNWQVIKIQQQSSLSPLWRTCFIFFFAHILFRDILVNAQLKDYPERYAYGWLAFFYVLILVVSTVLSLYLPSNSMTSTAWYVLSLISFWPMLPVVKAANFYNAQLGLSELSTKEKLTTKEILFVGIFGFFFAIITFSMFIVR